MSSRSGTLRTKSVWSGETLGWDRSDRSNEPLCSDPRQTNPFGRTYTVDCLGNMVGGKRCIYNNQPIELLMDLTRDSILANEAVWFGCEVSKR